VQCGLSFAGFTLQRKFDSLTISQSLESSASLCHSEHFVCAREPDVAQNPVPTSKNLDEPAAAYAFKPHRELVLAWLMLGAKALSSARAGTITKWWWI
jgi:hypothetical protein